MKSRCLILWILLLLTALAGLAQPQPGTPAVTPVGANKLAPEKPTADKGTADKGTTDKGTTAADAEPKVITHISVGSAAVIDEKLQEARTANVGSVAVVDEELPEAHIGDWLTLDVDGLKDLIDQAQKAKKPLQLFLNGLPVAGVPAVYYRNEEDADREPLELRFELVRTDASKDTWSALLGSPGFGKRKVQVSVGVAGCTEGCSDIAEPLPISLVIIRPGWALGFAVFFFALLAGLIYLAKKTPLLKATGPNSPWSLGRTQMAWWFLFVASSFLLIWVVTGSYSTLTNSVLALIGISAGTAMAGAVIDDNKQTQIKQGPNLIAEQASLQTANLTLRATDPAFQANNVRLQQIATQLAQLPKPKPSQGFWKDILSDEGGISLHRYQIVVWTVVFTMIFVSRVFVQLSMPDFDNQLLALMGISSGTYIGFKFPEKQA